MLLCESEYVESIWITLFCKKERSCKKFPKISGFFEEMLTNMANTQRDFWFEVPKKGRNKYGVFMFMRERERKKKLMVLQRG